MNLCRVQENVATPNGNSGWTEMEDNELSSLLSALSQSENEKARLAVQLEAAQEALFVHQNKTRNLMDALEEEVLHFKNEVSVLHEREEAALQRVSALEKALEDMQLEKQTLQKRSLAEVEAAICSERELRSSAEAEAKRLNRDLEWRSEENIGLRMTILKVQEDLTRENHHQGKAIEERDNIIRELKTTLNELRLDSEARNRSDLLTPESEEDEDCRRDPDHIWPRTSTSTASDLDGEARKSSAVHEEQKHIVPDEKEEELLRLREENVLLRKQLLRLQGIPNGSIASEVAPEIEDVLDATRPVESSPLDSPKDPEQKDKQAGLTSDQVHQQQCERLRRALRESQDTAKHTQDRADHVTYLLNQKLIELNKLQLTLSSQTKEMIQLEKAYFQLRNHLSRGMRSPTSQRSSRLDLSTAS